MARTVNGWYTNARLDATGYYTAGSLPAGTYVISADIPGYLSQTYVAPGQAPGPPTMVPLEPPADVGGIDFSLRRGGRVTGRITGLDSRPLPWAIVGAVAEGHGEYATFTDAHGSYALEHLPDETYGIAAGVTGRTAWMWYPGVSVLGNPEPVQISAAVSMEGIDLALPPAGDVDDDGAISLRDLMILARNYSRYARISRVVGSSMLPTLAEGRNIAVVNPLGIQRGVIVLFQDLQNPGQMMIKRVIGLPGETVGQ